MPNPFAFSSFLIPNKGLHFFGPTAKGLADDFFRLAERDGWVVVEWADVTEPFPGIVEGQRTVVRVRVRGQEDYDRWSFLLPELRVRLAKKGCVLLVGVNESDMVPTAWKFYAHARFRADTRESFTVVKDKASKENYHGYTFGLVDDAYVDATPPALPEEEGDGDPLDEYMQASDRKVLDAAKNYLKSRVPPE
jgi:hypothetical protein